MYGGKSSVTIKQKKQKMPFKDSRCYARKPLGRLLIYVVVNILSQVVFDFLLFLAMVMYTNEVETKEK